MKNKIISDPYILYGLNRNRKFLKSPGCECCGDKGMLVLEDRGALQSFCCSVLVEHDCENCAVFIVHHDGTYETIFKTALDNEEDDEDSPYSLAQISGTDRHFFAEVDGEMRFCCYSMLIEKKKGLYEIQD